MKKYPTNTKEINEVVSEQLKKQLEKKKISPSDFAANLTLFGTFDEEKKAGAKKTDISRILNRRKTPDLKTLNAFCNYLQCDIDYLLGTYSQPTKEATDVFEYTGLPAEMIDTLHQRMEQERMQLDAWNQTILKDEPIPVQALMVHPFLLHLILSKNAGNLFNHISDATTAWERITQIHSKPRHYKTVKEAFYKSLSDNAIAYGYLEMGVQQLQVKQDDVFETFKWNLTKMEDTHDTTDAFWNGWARKRFGMNIKPLFETLLLEFQFPQQKHEIESIFMGILQDYFKGGAE